LTIDEDDLMTEKLKTLHIEEWESDLDEPVGEENALFISATNKRISKSLENSLRSREANSHHPFLRTMVLYPDYKETRWKRRQRTRENE
jgi:GTP-binding protein HflX